MLFLPMRLDDLVEAGERTTQMNSTLGGVDLDELLVRVLAPPGAGPRRWCPPDLEQRLLDALARDVTGDRGSPTCGDLVDLVD